jgi:hypothetical protein
MEGWAQLQLHGDGQGRPAVPEVRGDFVTKLGTARARSDLRVWNMGSTGEKNQDPEDKNQKQLDGGLARGMELLFHT